MYFSTRDEFARLKNEAEALVIKELERQLELQDESVCRCEDCLLDMAGIAVNAVKPMYRSSLLGQMYAAQAMEDKEYARSIENAVAQAIEKVKNNPSHD
ncbi:MAG: late competence development ComFB family protein [Treponema sp.]|nr:late competence development ComFB family protein [Treponema sp.]